MRPSLYIRDDDYIESFTHGNFITLTNVKKSDIKKIIKYELKPLNISLHSFNQNIRNILFGNKLNKLGIENLVKLDRSKITTNIQIVLCPTINDGKDLENTLDILINQFKNIISIGIVPVGITKYNKEARLKAFDRHMSSRLIDFIKKYRIKRINNKNSKKIYLSDEYYIIGEKEFPCYEEYGKFEQLQNGIGKTIDFIHDIKEYLSDFSNKKYKINNRNILIVTSEYGRKVFKAVVDIINRFREIKCLQDKFRIDFLVVKNNFFGGNVKATGVLTGMDIINEVKKINIKDYNDILIPSVIFNKNGITLDDYSMEDLKKISNRIRFVQDNGKSLVKIIIGKQ